MGTALAKFRNLYENNRYFRGNVVLFLEGMQSEEVFREYLRLWSFNREDIDEIITKLKEVGKK